MFHLDGDLSKYEGQIIGPERYTEKTIINLSKMNRSVKLGIKRKYDDNHIYIVFMNLEFMGPRS